MEETKCKGGCESKEKCKEHASFCAERRFAYLAVAIDRFLLPVAVFALFPRRAATIRRILRRAPRQFPDRGAEAAILLAMVTRRDHGEDSSGGVPRRRRVHVSGAGSSKSKKPPPMRCGHRFRERWHRAAIATPVTEIAKPPGCCRRRRRWHPYTRIVRRQLQWRRAGSSSRAATARYPLT